MMFKKTLKIDTLEERKKWTLLRATDFDSLMKPCLYIWSLLGFFPYKCEPSTYVLSRPRYAFSTFVILIYTLSLFFVMYEINFSSLGVKNVPSELDVNLFLVLDGTAVLVMYILTNSRVLLLRNLSKLSSMLSSKNFNDLSKLVHTKNIVGFMFVILHIPVCIESNVFVTLKYCTTMYIIVVNFEMDMFYMDCVCILKACFKKIDESLQQLKPRIDHLVRDRINPWTTNNFEHHGQKNLLLLKLKTFQEKYLEISDMVEMVNNTFLLRTMIMAASTFTVVTFNLYFQIINAHQHSAEKRNFWYFQYASPAIFYFLKFGMMIWACETATDQAKNIHTTIHDVFSDMSDLEMAREVELFSLQMMHRKNIFTAKAIDMNATLLATMVKGITTYMLILFQFVLNAFLCNHR